MKKQERALLIVASRLLTYPNDTFLDEREDITNFITENITSVDILEELESACTSIYRLSLPELRKLYVATFDLVAENGLYLTAHELGDSTKRGAALIHMQNIINEAGFERVDDELADFLPMLFEFLAVTPNSEVNDRLIRRLAVSIQRIILNIRKDNTYYNILLALRRVFPKPTKQEISALEFEREEADLEELPFPIMYL